jgi:hypothetical protein
MNPGASPAPVPERASAGGAVEGRKKIKIFSGFLEKNTALRYYINRRIKENKASA